MSAIKAKPVRLIDILYTVNENEYVVVTLNNGRNSFSNKAAILEEQLKAYLSNEVKGMKVNGGVLQVFI